MADHTKIEWADATWGPTLGCLKISAGCEHCYAIRTVYRQEHAFKRPDYAGLTRRLPDGSLNWTGKVNVLPSRLKLPLTWSKPRRVFVDSQSDLFHEDVPDEFIDQVFAVMAWAERHTFQVLTKRPERMLRYFMSAQPGYERRDHVVDAMCATCLNDDGRLCGVGNDDCQMGAFSWPLPNVWLGVSVEDQHAANERIPLLLQTPAAVRFLSCEPLLGPVDLREPWPPTPPLPGSGGVYAPWMIQQLDWVIAGGESGPNARPMDLDWARSLRDQCQAAGVAFHFKQHGGRTHSAGGRLLDGREWNEFPHVREEVPA